MNLRIAENLIGRLGKTIKVCQNDTQSMNGNHELPKVKEITTHETDFFHVIDPKKWSPAFFTGPFLPITSSGDGNLPYKMTDLRGTTFIDYSQNFVLV